MTAEVATSPDFKLKGDPKALFLAPILGGPQSVERWDVTADGQRFRVGTNTEAANDPGSITVVLNWQSLLKKTVLASKVRLG